MPQTTKHTDISAQAAIAGEAWLGPNDRVVLDAPFEQEFDRLHRELKSIVLRQCQELGLPIPPEVDDDGERPVNASWRTSVIR
jgi:hypothetical protein